MSSFVLQRLPALEAPNQDRQGLVQSLDPRTRLVAAFCFAVFVVCLPSIASLLAALSLAIAAGLNARLPLAKTARRVLLIDAFLIFLLLMLPFTTPVTGPEDLMMTVWGLPASWSGLWHALRIVLTSNAVVLMMLALVGTLQAQALVQALAALRMPSQLVQILALSLRYIDIIAQEYTRLRTAMKMRAFELRRSWHCYRNMGYLLAMLLVRSLERSERVLAAMRCRGYDGRFPVLQTSRLKSVDWSFALGLAAVCALIAVLAYSPDLSWLEGAH